MIETMTCINLKHLFSVLYQKAANRILLENETVE